MTILELIAAIVAALAFIYLSITSASPAASFLCAILAGIGAGLAVMIIRDWRRR